MPRTTVKFSFQLNKYLRNVFCALGNTVCLMIPILLTIIVFLVSRAIMISKQVIEIKYDAILHSAPSLPYLTVSIFFFFWSLFLHILNLKTYSISKTLGQGKISVSSRVHKKTLTNIIASQVLGNRTD